MWEAFEKFAEFAAAHYGLATLILLILAFYFAWDAAHERKLAREDRATATQSLQAISLAMSAMADSVRLLPGIKENTEVIKDRLDGARRR